MAATLRSIFQSRSRRVRYTPWREETEHPTHRIEARQEILRSLHVQILYGAQRKRIRLQDARLGLYNNVRLERIRRTARLAHQTVQTQPARALFPDLNGASCFVASCAYSTVNSTQDPQDQHRAIHHTAPFPVDIEQIT